jgi:hypothetical protein
MEEENQIGNLNQSSGSGGGRGNSGGRAARVTRAGRGPGASPISMSRGADKLKQALIRYHVAEDVADAIAIMGVAAFVFMEGTFIEETLNAKFDAIQAKIVLGVRKAIIKEMDEVQSAVGGGGGAQASGGGNGGGGQQAANVQEHVAAGGGAVVAPVDPYTYGVEEAGKAAIYELYGVVGGGAATVGSRMPTCVRTGEVRRGFSTLLLPLIGVELTTSNLERKVQRGVEWTCIIKLMDRSRWGTLGRLNWDVDTSHYIIEILRGLPVPVMAREPFQKSCYWLNNIREFRFATDAELLRNVINCKWNPDTAQMESFEGKVGTARAQQIEGDKVGRNAGLVLTLRNFMWFMAAFVHECYLGTLEPLADGIQESEHLYRTSSRLLMYLINEEVGMIIRGVGIKDSVRIGATVYSLEGPMRIATALKAAGAKLLETFADRNEIRQLQITFDEETGDRTSVTALIAKVHAGNGEGDRKRKANDIKEEEVETGGEKTSLRTRKRLNRELRDSLAQGKPVNTGQTVAYVGGQAAAGANGARQPPASGANRGGQQGASSGGQQGPRRGSAAICNRYMAGLLKVPTATGGREGCSKPASECRFAHKSLQTTSYEEAKKSVLAMNDGDLRGRMSALLASSGSLFKP